MKHDEAPATATPQAEQQPADGLTVRTLETPSLGDRTYLVHDGQVGFVVDPQRDIDRVLELLDAEGIRLTQVLETHIHNDYVTGGLALARATGADYLVNGEDDVSFDRSPVADGDVVEVGGRMRVTALLAMLGDAAAGAARLSILALPTTTP